MILPILLVLALGVLPGGCRPSPEPPSSEKPSADSKRNEPAAPGMERRLKGGATTGEELPILRVAVAPVISPEESLILYKDFVELLAEQVGMRGVLLQRTSYSETNTLLRQRQCDVAFVCTYAFVQGQKDFGMELLVTPVVDGNTEYHSLFIVPASSAAESILELEGKRFASSDPLSNTGWLYPSYVLHEAGHAHRSFFSEVVFTGGHDRSIKAVADGIVDGAAVDSLVFDMVVDGDPDVGARTRVIHKSPAFGMPPVVVHPGLPEATRKVLEEALLAMAETPEGVRALALLHIDHFRSPDPSGYEAVAEMMRVLESKP